MLYRMAISMSTHKHFDKICYAVLAVTLIITALFMNGRALGISVISNEDEGDSMFTANDLNADWDASEATEIVLSDNGSTVNGNGAYAYNGNIYIVYAGRYSVSGSLSNGSIVVNADGDDKIWLLFNNVSINCDDNAALIIEQADKVFLTLADQTENMLSSGKEYRSDAVSSGIDGTVYSRDDLTVNGNGTLSVTAEYKHGIVCNDDLVITGGNIEINAVQDGLHANDSVRIKNADINISAGDDGITASNDDETAFIYVESGNISIPSCYEGIEAITVTIDGGNIDIRPSDDGINANGNGSESAIYINGGEITVINTNGRDADGLDSNKDIYISGGKTFISLTDDGSNSAIDYGSENGGVCEISGGTVVACGSSGMAEGFDSTSTQGSIMYTASASAGTRVVLTNSYGKELVSEEIPCSFSSVVISTPEMSVGDTCKITVGETEEELTIDNTSASSVFNNGGMMFGNGQNGGKFDMNGENDFSGGFRGDKNGKFQIPNGDNSENNENQSGIPSDMPELPNGLAEPPNGQNGDVPEMPNGQNGNVPELPEGEDFGDMQQPGNSNEDDDDGSRKDFFQNDEGFNRMPNGQNQNEKDKNISDAPKMNGSVNLEALIYIAVSFTVLIIGLAVALIIKKRK